MLNFLPIFCCGCWRSSRCAAVQPSLDERRLFLCQSCTRGLWHLRIPADSSPLEITDTIALYRYEGLIRDLIWRAKIKDDHSALDLLVQRGLLPKAFAAGNWADLIVSAPSSLWGRLRGRLDLASHLAQALANSLQKPHMTAPLHLYWRLSKNAQKVFFERAATSSYLPTSPLAKRCLRSWSHKLPQRPESLGPQRIRILIVDDVVTTGSTMRRVGGALAEAGQMQGYRLELRTLALAKSGT